MNHADTDPEPGDLIFISYKREESKYAKELQQQLTLRGYNVWIDIKAQTGHRWDQQIDQKLSSAKCVIVLWSPRSVQSPWVLLEAMQARDRLAPVSIDSAVSPPDPLGAIQYARLAGWDGGLENDQFQDLLGRIEGLGVAHARVTPLLRFQHPWPMNVPGGRVPVPPDPLIPRRLAVLLLVVGFVLGCGASGAVGLILWAVGFGPDGGPDKHCPEPADFVIEVAAENEVCRSYHHEVTVCRTRPSPATVHVSAGGLLAQGPVPSAKFEGDVCDERMDANTAQDDACYDAIEAQGRHAIDVSLDDHGCATIHYLAPEGAAAPGKGPAEDLIRAGNSQKIVHILPEADRVCTAP